MKSQIKVRQMCRVDGDALALIQRLRIVKREWGGYCAYRTATDEIMLTHEANTDEVIPVHGAEVGMVKISEIVKRCSPLLLWPETENDNRLTAYLGEGRRFESEEAARAYVRNENDGTESEMMWFRVL